MAMGVLAKSDNVGSLTSLESVIKLTEESTVNKILNNWHGRFTRTKERNENTITHLKLNIVESIHASKHTDNTKTPKSIANAEFEKSPPKGSMAGVESIEIDLPGDGIHTFHKTTTDTSEAYFQGEEYIRSGSQGTINIINSHGDISGSIVTNKAVYYLGSDKNGMTLEGVLINDLPEEERPSTVEDCVSSSVTKTKKENHKHTCERKYPTHNPVRLEDIINYKYGDRGLRGSADERRLADKRKLPQATQRIDVLVLYTEEAMMQQGNDVAIEARIDLAELETNQAFQLSGVYIDLNVVGKRLTREIDDQIFGPNAYSSMLERTRKNKTVSKLRDELSADLVVLVVENKESCGIAYKGVNPDFGFSVVNRVCMTGYFSFAHEIAHNLGCDHDRYSVNGDQHPYAHAYIDPPRQVRSILAYSGYCPGCARVQRFSNTRHWYANKKIGSSDANNARQLNNMSPYVASYRGEVDENGCQDIQVNGYPWHDGDGPIYNCLWYSLNNCAAYGEHTNPANGLNANQACCVCGGGRDTTICTSESSPASSRFSIQLMNMGENKVFDEAFQYAKEQWESVIVGDVVGYAGRDPDRGGPDLFNGMFNTGYHGSVDDLVIGYEVTDLEDRSVLGTAGPIYIRRNVGIPISGSIQLDSGQLSKMTPDDVKIIVTHEMGHVLGIGTMWDNACGSNCQNGDYTYTCPKAIEEHAKLGTSTSLLLEDEGGTGTACSHWDDASFSNEFVSEIMTGTFKSGKIQVLSRVSAAALEDIGYQVDYCGARDFTVIAADASVDAKSVADLLSPSKSLNIVMGQTTTPQILDAIGSPQDDPVEDQFF
eukprot:CAMPEP_0195512646 /NCGR_PEP_ID=MMETSP0794_2-20130614/4532_1 /TAXON_ID=515487 /ORGANISM="Stephanopyxis turris, Strain CCMP 815" /LENGTH=825 /DNA_ID=CAMNT_0040640477 /DNA_START=251 /DNA_END=2728 /DNA_ORIENTATION=+